LAADFAALAATRPTTGKPARHARQTTANLSPSKLLLAQGGNWRSRCGRGCYEIAVKALQAMEGILSIAILIFLSKARQKADATPHHQVPGGAGDTFWWMQSGRADFTTALHPG